MFYHTRHNSTQSNYTLTRGISCVLQVCPYLALHIIRRPYRRNIPAIDYTYSGSYSRYRLACFDALFNIVLDGYAEVSGQPVLSTTGQFFFLTLELTKSLDETLDEALAEPFTRSFHAEEILAADFVQKNLDNFKNYLRISNAPSEEIIAYLKERFDSLFEQYVLLSKTASETNQFSDILRVSEMDNGIWLSSLADMIALFNRHGFSDPARHDFYNFGLVGKLIDDIVDIRRDIHEGRLNLLYALLKEHGSCVHLHTAINHKQQLTQHWWLKHYFVEYTEYFDYINNYLSRIRSKKLRLACDMMMIPAVLGYDYDPAR